MAERYENTFVREVKEENITKPEDILNWYRNLYHTEDNHTEHGIMAYAINDYFADVVPKSEVEKLKAKHAVQSFQDAATIDSLQYKLKVSQGLMEKGLYSSLLKITLYAEIFAEIEAEITAALKSNYEARSVYNPTDEFGMWVQGKIDALRGIEDFIAELKKKYTEEKHEN